MQILSFEDGQESMPRKKKRSSKGLIAVGFVAVMFGVSTAFASSTIAINTNNKVDLGQGVATVSGCDTDVTITPTTTLNIASLGTVTPYFDLTNLEISKFDATTCGGKTMQVQLFGGLTEHAYQCGEDIEITSGSITDVYAYTGLTVSCDGDTSTIKMKIPTEILDGATNRLVPRGNPARLNFIFTKAPSDISHITLVSAG